MSNRVMYPCSFCERGRVKEPIEGSRFVNVRPCRRCDGTGLVENPTLTEACMRLRTEIVHLVHAIGDEVMPVLARTPLWAPFIAVFVFFLAVLWLITTVGGPAHP